ncbi:MAG: hypothetical protein WA294_03270 [Acidobacteriaceae bacterium]
MSAYAPELQPGVVISTGANFEEARSNIAEAMTLWIEQMRSSGQPVPPSPVRYEFVEIAG